MCVSRMNLETLCRSCQMPDRRVKETDGIACIECGSTQSFIRDSRKVEGGVRRQRVCRKCDEVYVTFEAVEQPEFFG